MQLKIIRITFAKFHYKATMHVEALSSVKPSLPPGNGIRN